MTENNIAGAISSDLTNTITDYSVTASDTDGDGDQKEFTYQNTKWSSYYGYYKAIPELKIAVDTKANWVMGNGFEADETTEILLDGIKGNGKESFNSILENMERTCYIGEDSYAEVMRDNDDVLINLKTLDPGTIVRVFDQKGRLKRFEQVSKHKKPNKKFKIEQIFTLSHNKMADEPHGTSIIPSVQWVIDARNEAMSDWRKVLHWNVYPRWKIALDTDDTARIAAFKKTYDSANSKGENMYIPKGTVEVDVLGIAPNATLNPLNWIEQLNDYFFQAVGVPQIIVGNAKSFTDASGKIVYLAFEQRIKGRQKYVEEQILGQLNVEIQLTFPASLQNEAISDTPSETDLVEEEPIEGATQPNDTTEELEGKA